MYDSAKIQVRCLNFSSDCIVVNQHEEDADGDRVAGLGLDYNGTSVFPSDQRAPVLTRCPPRYRSALYIIASRNEHGLRNIVPTSWRIHGDSERDGNDGGSCTPTASRFRSDDDVLEAKSREAFERLSLITTNEQTADLPLYNVATEEAHACSRNAIRRDVPTAEGKRCPATLPHTAKPSIRP